MFVKEYRNINVEEKMTFINLFSKIFRSLIILFFILFTFSSFNVSSYILGQDNICSSEKNDIDEKCENNCLCDRDQLIHVRESSFIIHTFTMYKELMNRVVIHI